MLIEKKLIEILPENPGTTFDFKGIYVDAAGVSHNVTVFDTSYFMLNAVQLCRSRRLFVDETNPSTYLATLFASWKASRENLYLKQAYAYTLKYNPIENYSSVETMIDDETVHAKGASSKTEYNNSDTDELTPFTKETTETTPYTKETTETHPYTKETTETHPYTKETTETHPYTKETTETHPYTMETTETTPYNSETTTTTGISSGGTTPPNNKTTNSRMAFNSNTFVSTDKTETETNTQNQLVKDGTEKVEFSKTGTEKVEFSKTGTEKVEFSKTGTEKVEFSKTGTEKVEFSKTGTEKTEITKDGTEKREITHDGYVETTTDGSDTDTRNYTLKKSGNIGIQTAAEMLQREFDGLKQDLAFRAFSEFIDRYTYYMESLEGWW